MSNTNSFQLTDKAIKAIKKAIEQDNTLTYLRVGVRGSGCSGYTPIFQFETIKKDNDILFEQNGAVVIIDPKSMQFLQGAVLNYHFSLMKSEFRLTSPKIISTCGCGKSVSFDK